MSNKNESPELVKFKQAVCNIRSSSDYSGSLIDIADKLGVPEKMPKETRELKIEALLIHATRERYKKTLDADMALMALGLLKGFDNPRNPSEERSGSTLITVRRKMFIKMSSYVADRHNHNNKRRKRHYESYEELEAAGKDAIEAVISALGSEDGTNIKEVARKLYSKKRNIEGYMEESDKYLIYDGDSIVDVKLQDLTCVRKKGKPPGPRPEPTKSFPKKRFIISLSVFVASLVVLIGSHCYVNQEISEAVKDASKIKPPKIEIMNNNIELFLEETADLKVKTEPDELRLKDLIYTSSNPEVAQVENIHSGHVIAVKKLADNSSGGYSNIVVTDDKGIAQDTATVLVIGKKR